MKIIDLHQDILIHQRGVGSYKYLNQTGLTHIKNSDIKIVFGTGFVFGKDQDIFSDTCFELIDADIDEYTKFAKENSDCIIVKSKDDIEKVENTERCRGIVIHIEGLNTFQDNEHTWNKLEVFYQKGLRSIGIVWSKENSLGGGNDNNEKGLTLLGKKVVQWLQDKDILIDYAHMNEKTFFDVAHISNKPIFISHGNAKTVCGNDRNYTDAQLIKVKETNGLIGVFFANSCLVSDGLATVEDVIKHIKYIRDLIGIDYIGIGSDLGGLVLNIPEGLRNVFELSNLQGALLAHGFTVVEIENILYKNALRFLKENLQNN